MKILIVEDDKVSQKLADSILSKNGYETLLAGSVEEAIKQVETGGKICLTLLDIKLPDQDGYSFQVYLKSKSQYKSIPVVMCSSSEDKESVMQSISLGAVGYLKKPIKSETLLPKIEEVLSKRFKTILIVDDEKMIRDLLRATLEREGYNTAIAESGVEALKIMESQKIDAVLSDIQMDEMSGIELLKTIKTKYDDLPVMLVTGNSSKYSQAEMRMAGADGYITKPFKNLEILDAVRKMFCKNLVS